MKIRTTIRMDSETLKKAHQLGLNVSKCSETALKMYIEALTKANSQMQDPSFLGEASFTKEGSMRPPGFEPGSSAWQADVLTKLDYGRFCFE